MEKVKYLPTFSSQVPLCARIALLERTMDRLVCSIAHIIYLTHFSHATLHSPTPVPPPVVHSSSCFEFSALTLLFLVVTSFLACKITREHTFAVTATPDSADS